MATVLDQHQVETVREGNDSWFRCSCGAQLSTYTGVDNHMAGVLRSERDRLAAENERLRSVLGYIAQPTMGFQPSAEVASPVDYVDHAPEGAVRTALKTCIGMAQAALGAKREERESDGQ